jgi:hypothetical protein
MDLIAVLFGIYLLFFALYFALHWRREADWLRRYATYMSEADDRPWWRRGHFIPNSKQAVLIAWLVIGACTVVGVISLGRGLGVL